MFLSESQFRGKVSAASRLIDVKELGYFCFRATKVRSAAKKNRSRRRVYGVRAYVDLRPKL